ncbi:MAG: DUF3570 domain-containing protein [Gammaproteobacteria bacterium]|nr:MAG: DUF3570 domain-containing protein [Gammaproteobacteria bacterium]
MKHEKAHAVRARRQVVAVDVIRMRHLLLPVLLLNASSVMALILPQDRVDAMYHSYDGGGITINGPSVLVRKSVGDSVSVSANHYVDSISSASVDVVSILGPSRYAEERTQNSLGVDYLYDKSMLSLSYTSSVENDFDATTTSFGITQEMFGGLTTVSMSVRFGDNIIRETGDLSTNETSETVGYRVGLSQVLTKNMIAGLTYEIITDEGFLNNPYRKVRYLTSPTTFAFEDEVYPNTRTSNAVSLSMRYFLPYRAALYGSYRYFIDSWDIEAGTYEIGYTHPYDDNWLFDVSLRLYSQTSAEFYSDLYNFSQENIIRARDKELSTYSSQVISIGTSYEFGKQGLGPFEKSSVNLYFSYFMIDYDDFRDIPLGQELGLPPGQEPLYELNASVIRFYLSFWF